MTILRCTITYEELVQAGSPADMLSDKGFKFSMFNRVPLGEIYSQENLCNDTVEYKQVIKDGYENH